MTIFIVGPDRKIKGGIGTLMSILCRDNQRVRYLHENSNNFFLSLGNFIYVLFKIVFSNSDDIFHFNVSVKTNITRVYMFALMAYIFNRKFIAHSHWFELPSRYSFRGRLFNFIYSRTSHAVFLSDFWRNQFFERGFSTMQYSVIHNCADSESFSEKVDSIDAFIFVGSLSKRKGVDILLEAYALYRDLAKEPKQLILIGSELKSKTIEFPKIPGLELWGEKSNNEVTKTIASSTCLILPSQSEGVPIVLIEALLNSTPVITTDTFGIESVLPSIRPFLVHYGDSVGLCNKMIDIDKLSGEQTKCFKQAGVVFDDHRFKQEFNELYKKVALLF